MILLPKGQWQYLAITFDGANLSLYINAIQTASIPLVYTMPSINRKFNYVGKSNTPLDGYSASYIDDLKFYSIALNESQINSEFICSGSYQMSQSLGVTNSFLVNHWPFDNGSLSDMACGEGKNMTLSSQAGDSFVADRFG